MTDDKFDRDNLLVLSPYNLFPSPDIADEINPKSVVQQGLIKNDMFEDWNEKNTNGPSLIPPEPRFQSEEVQDNYLTELNTDDSACEKCCNKRLIITIERHTAVMLEDKKWWGIVGTMTASIASKNTLITTGKGSDFTDAFPKLTTIPNEELPFTTPTFEQKGPPTKEGGIKRAIPPGTYQIRPIHGNLHSTYAYNESAGVRKLRGMNIFGEGGGYSPLSKGRGIDIHVGGNATFTTGCILPAPGITYGDIPPKEQNKIRESFGVTKSRGLYEFRATKPTWSADASLLKITELIEMIEDFKGIDRGKLPIGKAITCVDIVIKQPPDNVFNKVVVLKSTLGPISDKVKIESVTILNEEDYTCVADGITYKVTTKKNGTDTGYTVNKL